jgi:hypothetical protein
MLFQEEFDAIIASEQIEVSLKIYAQCHASFEYLKTSYTFQMRKWAKTRERVDEARNSFNSFADLLLEKNFGGCGHFGTIERSDVNGMSSTTVHNPTQVSNILRYSVREVFVCANQIICKYKRHLLPLYCLYHLRNDKHSTYEEYIHLVANQSLVDANFLNPGLVFPAVEYCEDDRGFQPGYIGTHGVQ